VNLLDAVVVDENDLGHVVGVPITRRERVAPLDLEDDVGERDLDRLSK